MKNWKRRILAGVLAVALIVSGIWIGNQASVVDAATLPEKAEVGGTITLSDGTTVEIVKKTSLAPGHTATDTLVQFGSVYNWGLSAQTKLSFEGTVMLDGKVLDSSSYRFDGYSELDTIALYVNGFNGKVLTILEGSVIYYNGKAVVITETFNRTWSSKGDSGTWVAVSAVPVYEEDSYIWIDGQRRVIQQDVELKGGTYGTNALAQFDVGYAFTCPADNTTLGFYGTLMLDGEKEIVNITGDADPRFVGYPSGNTITLFRSDIDSKLVTILEGSIFYYGDNAVRVTKDFNSTYTSGGTWTENPRVPGKEYVKLSDGTLKEKVAKITLTPEHTASTLVQFTNVYDFGVAENERLSFDGTVRLDGEILVVPDQCYFSGYKGNTTICLNFGSAHKGKVVTIEKGSVIYYGNKAVVIGETFNQKWDGSSWTPVAEIPSPADTTISFSAVSHSTNGLIQVKTSLPTDTVRDNKTTNWVVYQSGRLQFSFVSEVVSGDTYYIAFNFAENFKAGETYVLEKDSIFVFGEKQYKLDKTYTFYCTGNGFVVIEGEFSFTDCNHTESGTIMWKTTLPETSATGDGTNYIKTSGLSVSAVTLFTGVDPYVLQFVFTSNATEGDKFTVEKGSVFQSGGAYYSLDDTYIFLYTGGTSWTMIKGGIVGTFGLKSYHWGVANVVQINHAFSEEEFGTAYTATPTAVYLKESGQYLAQGFQMYNDSADGRKVFQINFKGSYSADETYVLEKGSMVQFADGVRELDANYILTYDGSKWTCQKEGDANIDYTIDSRDLVKVKNVEAGLMAYTASCDIIADSVVDHWDTSAMRQILLDTYDRHAGVTSTKEYLLAESNFNGGGEFVTFADCPPDPTDTDKMQEYKDLRFNTSLIAVNEDNTNKEYVTMDVEDTDYQLEPGEKELQFTALKSGSSELMQLTTNLPRGISVDNFTAEDTTHVINKDWSRRPGWFSVLDDGNTNKVYLNMHFAYDKLVEGDYVILKAGTKLKVSDTYYVLTKNYTLKYLSYYHDAIDTLKSLDLHAWLRNESNKANLFTAATLNKIAPYASDVDGVYFTDEPFWTTEMKNASNTLYKQNEQLMTFADIQNFVEREDNLSFNDYFSGKYFHVNHSGATSFNKYCKVPIQAFDMPAYYNYLTAYTTNVIAGASTDTTKKNIGFDHYPFGYLTYSVQNFGGIWGIGGEDRLAKDGYQGTGISPYYLINLLISAKVAKENKNSMSVAIQTYLDTTNEAEKRGIEKKEEITMQLYATMACGVDVYEYYLYNTVESQNQYGMIDATGNKTDLYRKTQDANKEALPFADVLKTFEWQGAEFVTGTTSHNGEALSLVTSNSSLNLMLDEDSDGVLTNASDAKPTNDILVGYYKKGEQGAYMVANYNDPEQVKDANEVTLNFGDCNYARVYTGRASGLTSEIVELNGGSYTFTLQPGGGCFVIPVKATS